MSREILKECSHMAVDQAELLRGAEAWEEWQEEGSTAVSMSMSKKEEKYLWARLDELDKEQHKINQKLQAKKLSLLPLPAVQPRKWVWPSSVTRIPCQTSSQMSRQVPHSCSPNKSPLGKL